MNNLKDNFFLGLLMIACIILLPFLIILGLIDDVREDKFERNKSEYYQRYL